MHETAILILTKCDCPPQIKADTKIMCCSMINKPTSNISTCSARLLMLVFSQLSHAYWASRSGSIRPRDLKLGLSAGGGVEVEASSGEGILRETRRRQTEEAVATEAQGLAVSLTALSRVLRGRLKHFRDFAWALDHPEAPVRRLP